MRCPKCNKDAFKKHFTEEGVYYSCFVCNYETLLIIWEKIQFKLLNKELEDE